MAHKENELLDDYQREYPVITIAVPELDTEITGAIVDFDIDDDSISLFIGDVMEIINTAEVYPIKIVYDGEETDLCDIDIDDAWDKVEDIFDHFRFYDKDEEEDKSEDEDDDNEEDDEDDTDDDNLKQWSNLGLLGDGTEYTKLLKTYPFVVLSKYVAFQGKVPSEELTGFITDISANDVMIAEVCNKTGHVTNRKLWKSSWSVERLVYPGMGVTVKEAKELRPLNHGWSMVEDQLPKNKNKSLAPINRSMSSAYPANCTAISDYQKKERMSVHFECAEGHLDKAA